MVESQFGFKRLQQAVVAELWRKSGKSQSAHAQIPRE
jgi:hypothetical protein